jgi:hypothetical protein
LFAFTAQVYPEEWLTKENIPLDLKVAFPHPDFPDNDILIFIQADMPHLLKKFVNALERSSLKKHKTKLRFRGKSMSLLKLHKLWKASELGYALRTSKFTTDHYFKNAYSRMRAFLAFQITSNTMVELIDVFADSCGGIEEYRPMQELLKHMDRLIDIMNKRRDKGFTAIDSPTHESLLHLEETMILFVEWEKEAGKKKHHFIPASTHQDLCWLCLSTIGMGRLYLNEDKSKAMSQDRHGSDCCEHHFGNMKGKNPNGTKADCDEATAKSTSVRSNTFNTSAKTNTAGASLRSDEITQPLRTGKIKK